MGIRWTEDKIVKLKEMTYAGESAADIADYFGVSQEAMRKKRSVLGIKVTENPKVTEITENPKVTEITENPKVTEITENPKVTEITENPKVTEKLPTFYIDINGAPGLYDTKGKLYKPNKHFFKPFPCIIEAIDIALFQKSLTPIVHYDTTLYTVVDTGQQFTMEVGGEYGDEFNLWPAKNLEFKTFSSYENVESYATLLNDIYTPAHEKYYELL
jgi:hypothetical protein